MWEERLGKGALDIIINKTSSIWRWERGAYL